MSEADPAIFLRPFTVKDQAPAKALILDGLGDHFPDLDETLNSDLDDISGNYLDRGHAFVIAEADGLVVGAGGLMILDPQLGRLVRVSVARERRRQGIGSAIVAHLVMLARKKGLNQLLVETNHDWSDAISLYRESGFALYAEDEVSVHLMLDLRHR